MRTSVGWLGCDGQAMTSGKPEYKQFAVSEARGRRARAL